MSGKICCFCINVECRSSYFCVNLFEATLGRRPGCTAAGVAFGALLSGATSGANVPPHYWEKRKYSVTICLVRNLFPVFDEIEKTTVSIQQKTSVWDPAMGSRPNDIRLSPRRNSGRSQTPFFCTDPAISKEQRKDLFKLGSGCILYHISDLRCTLRAYHLNIAVRIN